MIKREVFLTGKMTTIRISDETKARLNEISKKRFKIPFEYVSKDYLIKTILEDYEKYESTENNKK
jgi:predicted DNA-binding protein